MEKKLNFSKYSFIFFLLTLTILPLLGNEELNSILHINKIATLFNYIIPILLSLSIFIDFRKQKTKFKFDYKIIFLFLFVLFLIISFVFSIVFKIYNFTNLVKFLIMSFILITLINYELTDKQKKIVIRSLLILLTVTSLYGIIQYLFKFQLTFNGIEKYPGAKGRIKSTFYITTLFDKYLVTNILLCFYLLYNNYEKKKFVLPALLLGIIAFALTFSRTGLVVFLFFTIIFVIYFVVKKKWSLLLILLFFNIVNYLVPGQNYVYSSLAEYTENKVESIEKNTNTNFISKISNPVLNLFIKSENDIIKSNKKNKKSEKIDIQLKENIDFSVESRKYFRTVAKNVLISNPITGIGIGSYNYIYNEQNASKYIKSHYSIKSKYLYPHNMYMQLGAEIGFIGMIMFFIYLIISMISYSIKNKNIFTFLMLINLLLSCYSESIFYMKDIGYYSIIIIIIFSSDILFKSNKQKKS